MIPTLLLPSLVIGRWWLVPVAAVIWPLLLVVVGAGRGLGFVLSAGALAAANVAVAVSVHVVAARLLRAATRNRR